MLETQILWQPTLADTKNLGTQLPSVTTQAVSKPSKRLIKATVSPACTGASVLVKLCSKIRPLGTSTSNRKKSERTHSWLVGPQLHFCRFFTKKEKRKDFETNGQGGVRTDHLKSIQPWWNSTKDSITASLSRPTGLGMLPGRCKFGRAGLC